jgi:predicted N-formylglutamate amidohydrolase
MSWRSDEAYDRRAGGRHAAVLLTCEHASDRLPEPYRWPDEDERLMGTHWAYDLGAGELTASLAERLDAPAVRSRFSRLLVDPNRAEDSPTLFRVDAEGEPVGLNRDPDRSRRLREYYHPYHSAVDEAVGGHDAPMLLSIHSFTPLYEGEPRFLEVGVLYDKAESEALELAGRLDRAGFRVELNAPYSGLKGHAWAIEHHAARHERKALELEVRQDLCVQPDVRQRLVDAMSLFFER